MPGNKFENITQTPDQPSSELPEDITKQIEFKVETEANNTQESEAQKDADYKEMIWLTKEDIPSLKGIIEQIKIDENRLKDTLNGLSTVKTLNIHLENTEAELKKKEKRFEELKAKYKIQEIKEE